MVVSGLMTVEPTGAVSVTVLGRPVSMLMPPVATIGPTRLLAKA